MSRFTVYWHFGPSGGDSLEVGSYSEVVAARDLLAKAEIGKGRRVVMADRGRTMIVFGEDGETVIEDYRIDRVQVPGGSV